MQNHSLLSIVYYVLGMHLYVREEKFSDFSLLSYFREYCGITVVVFYFKTCKMWKISTFNFQILLLFFYRNVYVNSSRYIWIKNSSCKCNFHPESFSSFPLHTTWILCTQNLVGKSAAARGEKSTKILALLLSRQQWTLSRSAYARGVGWEEWISIDTEKKTDNYCFWDSLFYNLSFSSRSSEFIHSIPSPRSRLLFFGGWNCCLLCSWFLFLQICLMAIKNTNGKLLLCFLCCLCCCYTHRASGRGGKKVLRVKI